MNALALDQRAACGEAYKEVKELILRTVRSFWLRYGGDLEEYESEATMAFLKGDTAWREGRANATTYETEIKRWVWYELFDRYRVTAQHRRKQKVVIKRDENIGQILMARKEFNRFEYMDCLSEDARLAAELVLDTPAELAAAAREKGGTDLNMRSVIRQYFRDLGWSAARINEAFTEAIVAIS